MRAAAAVTALGLVSAWAGDGIRAQSASRGQEVTVLTLREALERAVRFNPEYRQALNRMELEGPQRRQAWGAFLPRVDISYGTGQSFRQETTALDFFGNPIENPEAEIVTSSYADQGARLNLDLLRGGARFHAFGEARAQARVDRLTAERDLNTVLAEVERQFLVAQRQKARLAVEEELLAARERDFDGAERRFELAAIGRSDLYAVSLELEQQRVTVREVRGEVEKGMLALRAAIGDPSLLRVDLEQTLPEPFDPARLDLDGFVAEALAMSPAVSAAEAARSVQQSRLSSARASRWPTLSLSSGFSRSSYVRGQSALFDLDPGDFAGSVSLSVQIPLFTRFETSRQIAGADVELRNAGEQVRQAELQLEEQVRARYVDLETAWTNVRHRETVLEVAVERLRIVQEEYRLATKSIEELRAAIREEAEALRELVQQRFEFAVALVGLYEAAGIVAGEAGLNTTLEQG